MIDESTEQWDDSAAENWTPPELRTRKSGVSGAAASVVVAPPLIDQTHTGCLARQPLPFEPKPLIDPKSIPVTKPDDVSDSHWQKISADTDFMRQMEALDVYARGKRIEEYAFSLDKIERTRESDAALNVELRRRHEAEVAAAVPTVEQRLASVEAALIELKVRFATVEAALEALKPKAATVTKIRTSHPTKPAA